MIFQQLWGWSAHATFPNVRKQKKKRNYEELVALDIQDINLS